MRSLLLAALVLSALIPARAGDDSAIRPARQVTMHFSGLGDTTHPVAKPVDGKARQSPADRTETFQLADAPYIDPQGVITLFPGDKILVEFDLVNGQPKNPHVVKTTAHPERTLELEMTQDVDMSAVNRKSGFDKPLAMRSYFLLLHAESPNNANMAPLQKNLPCFDSFEPKAYCVKLYDFSLTAPEQK